MTIPRNDALARTLPFGLFILLLAARGLVESEAASLGHAVDARWLYALQAGIPLLVMLRYRNRYEELHDAPRSAGAWILAALAGTAVLLFWISPIAAWARLDDRAASFSPLTPAGDLDWGLILARTTGAVLVVPVMEELFWRSFLLRWLERRSFLEVSPARTGRFALLASSGVFALAHDLWLAGFLAGLVYTLLYRRLGNLWYCVIAHATTNLLLAAWVVATRSWEYW